MKINLDLFAPKVSSIIEHLMTRFSRWELIKNVLARIFYFGNKKLNFQEAQKKVERTIFLQYQKAAQNYLKGFKGSPYYVETVDGIICVTGRKLGGVHSSCKLVPPGCLLYKQVTNWAHKRFHFFGPNYIKTQLQLHGYWVPQALKHLKKLQDQAIGPAH